MATESVNGDPVYGKRVCLMTGAAGRLGTAFCRLFADQYDIVAVYRSRPPQLPSQRQWLVDVLEPWAALPENEHPVFAVQADLERDGEVERVVDIALARFDRIDVVVNAAVHSVWAPMVDSNQALESAERQFRVNTLLPAKLAVHVARTYWRDRDLENRTLNRNVVNVSSLAGVAVVPGMGQGVYSASKVALNFLTRHLADEFSRFGVRVNALAPDSFPSRVRTRAVATAVNQLDRGGATGKVLVMDAGGQRMQ